MIKKSDSFLGEEKENSKRFDSEKGIYIHIPFCSSKCFYCDFFSQVKSSSARREYVSALCSQIKNYGKNYLKKPSVRTAYIGGGTPSILTGAEFEAVFSSLRSVFDFSETAEFTVETNPESTTEELLFVLKRNGVNRISLGIQSLSDAELQSCGRRHSGEEALAAVKRIKDAGFDNISADVIIGLPGQTETSFLKTLDGIATSGVNHISAYILKIEENTVFSHKGVSESDEEKTETIYLLASEFLSKKGFEHYEISNFARDNKRGIHNFSYWQGKNYIAFGAGAYGYEDSVRYHYSPSLEDFLASKGNAERIVDEVLSFDDKKKEELLLLLRTSDGVSASFFDEKTLFFARKLEEKGLGVFKNGRFSLLPRGFLVSNPIISEFLSLYDERGV